MARIRSIKPEFWTSEQVVECSPNARLLFIGMWTFADDGGVLPDSLKRLKMQVFPGDDISRDDMLTLVDELIKNGLIRRFTHENSVYFLVTGWHHQKIDKPTYKFPQPNEQTKFDEHSASTSRTVAERSPTDVEGRGEDDYMSASSKQTYSDDFEAFWMSFPKFRRTKKQEAYRKWKVAIKRADSGLLIQKAAEYANSERGKSEYAVMPSVWLNGGMWEDDPVSWGAVREQAPLRKLGRVQRHGT